ncbi:hypothetical protein I6M33_06930 [Shewanella algae]|uniref:hypothetical protein n=1 Tax=Shewanella algae TaxID=38313 RepID=UPI001AAD10EE|nr:hypothetical protein [Shewanella algae]MBO2560355.1 hypothetical protein [Shewanella algae]
MQRTELRTAIVLDVKFRGKVNPKLPPHLLYIQMYIGAGSNTDVTVAKQLTGGLPVVSTSAASITLQLVIDRRRS